MKTRLGSTLLALTGLGALGGIATADEARPMTGAVSTAEIRIGEQGSRRGVTDEYLVKPSGGELSAQMRFVTSDPTLGGTALKFSDLALFDLAARWSLAPRLEVSASVALLPKQPSFTDEKVWQSVSAGLRTPLGHHAALALGGSGGHLLDHEGMWMSGSAAVEWRKPIAEIMTFDVGGGFDGVSLSAPGASSAWLAEVSASTSVLFRDPHGWTGGWVGVSYALPLASHGDDPTTGLAIDPQPRLDLRLGGVLALVQDWDVFAELAIIDRGDLSNPSTRLPILDGGFDQHQIIFGVTRHISKKRSNHGADALLVGKL